MKKPFTNLKKSLPIILLTQLFSASAFCQNFTDLGVLPSSTSDGLNSEAMAISNNGSVIVGKSGVNGSTSSLDSISGGDYRAFIFAIDENGAVTKTELGTLGGSFSAANGVSYDGSLIVGDSYLNGNNEYHAFIYDTHSNDPLTLIDLGVLTGGTNSSANAISANGNIIVGRSDTGPTSFSAFKIGFDLTNNTIPHPMINLGSLTSGGNSQARAVSFYGEVIVGSADIVSSTVSKAFKYVESENAMYDLGNLGGSFSDAYAVSSYNGSVIVGESTNSSGNKHAFRYTDTEGMVDLGTFAGGLTSSARGISGDGSIIVGQASTAANYQHGFVLYAGKGMVDIGTLGGNNSYINAISLDGSIVTGKSDIGTPNNAFHAFIAKTSDFANIKLVDTDNTAVTILSDASKTNAILNQKSNILNLTLDQDAKLFGKNNLHISVGTRYANITPNSIQSYAGTLKVAYLFNKHFRAGLYLDQTIDSNFSQNFTMQNAHPAIAAFATLSENQKNKGFKLKLSVAHDSNNINIKRTLLANTESGQGTSRLTAKGAMAELSYGFNFKNTFRIEPFTAIRYTKINRNGYVESDNSADFPIAYQDMTKKTKTLLFGSRFAAQLTKKLSLRAQLAVEHDTNNSIDSYNGHVSYLTSFDIEAKDKFRKNRRSIGVGSTYSINKTQEIGFDVFHNQQSLSHNKGTLAYLYYSIGL